MRILAWTKYGPAKIRLIDCRERSVVFARI